LGEQSIKYPRPPPYLQRRNLLLVANRSSPRHRGSEYQSSGKVHFSIKHLKHAQAGPQMVKHKIGLQKLRYNIIDALKATVPTESNTCFTTQPEAWINGFGEVVEAGLLSATDCKDRLYEYKNGFEKDARYKQMYCMVIVWRSSSNLRFRNFGEGCAAVLRVGTRSAERDPDTASPVYSWFKIYNQTTQSLQYGRLRLPMRYRRTILTSLSTEKGFTM
jgi:hypothetical protein